MNPKFDTTAIENEKKALQLLAAEMQKATDEDQRDMLMGEIKKSADKMQAMCEEMQAEADKIRPPEVVDAAVHAVVEVVLTPEQRRRVLEETGIDVPSVRIPDPTGELTKNMPSMDRSFVEKCAISQANAFKQLVADAEESAEMESDSQE